MKLRSDSHSMRRAGFRSLLRLGGFDTNASYPFHLKGLVEEGRLPRIHAYNAGSFDTLSTVFSLDGLAFNSKDGQVLV